MTTTLPSITWEGIIAIEPALAQLESKIKPASPDTPDVEFFRGWRDIKQQLCRLAGWESRDQRLRSSQTYNIVYQHLYALYTGGTDR